VKEVFLTRGYVALVDDEDYGNVMRYRWYVLKARKCRRTPYATRKGKRGETPIVSMHRHILGNRWPEIDHINGNGLDNRRSNLRPCNRSQNLANSRDRDRKWSHYRGVTFCEESGRWHAQLQYRGKHRHLGTFLCEEDAAAAYDLAARRYFGDFAVTNDVLGDPSCKGSYGQSGATNGRCKLTAEAVAAIRSSTEPTKTIAGRYMVTTRHVNRLRRGEMWHELANARQEVRA
jgi:hypothetical protein